MMSWSRLIMIKFLFTGCLVRNQPENVLKTVSEMLYIIHYYRLKVVLSTLIVFQINKYINN